jgi:hypothetical protein
MTSQIFRCHGLLRPSPQADQLGFHDLAYWLIFVSILAGWFLFIFAPQRERLQMLQDRTQVLKNHRAAELRERKRMERSIAELQRGDPRAWERAARDRLGWIEPGEITNIAAWIPNQRIQSRIEFQRPSGPPPIPSVPPRPIVPNLPMAPANIRMMAQNKASAADLVGPSLGTPPQPIAVSRVVQTTPRLPSPPRRIGVTASR